MLVFYSLTIFRKANVQLNNYLVSILVQSGITLGYIISSFLMSRVPRKIHFIAAGLFMATNLLAAGIILQAEEVCHHLEPENYRLKLFHCRYLRRDHWNHLWTQCYQYSLFWLVWGMGLGSVQSHLHLWVKCCQPKSRHLHAPYFWLSGICKMEIVFPIAKLCFYRNAVTFFNLRFFPPIVSALGLHSAFWLYSGILFFNCILSAFVLPETRGMSLTELEQLYQKKRSPRSTKSVSFCCIDSKEFEAKEK